MYFSIHKRRELEEMQSSWSQEVSTMCERHAKKLSIWKKRLFEAEQMVANLEALTKFLNIFLLLLINYLKYVINNWNINQLQLTSIFTFFKILFSILFFHVTFRHPKLYIFFKFTHAKNKKVGTNKNFTVSKTYIYYTRSIYTIVEL